MEPILAAKVAANATTLIVAGVVAFHNYAWAWRARAMLRKMKMGESPRCAALLATVILIEYAFYGSARVLKDATEPDDLACTCAPDTAVIDLWEFWPGVLAIPTLYVAALIYSMRPLWSARDLDVNGKTGGWAMASVALWLILACGFAVFG